MLGKGLVLLQANVGRSNVRFNVSQLLFADDTGNDAKKVFF